MISSAEEFLLLLKKWKTESTQVVAMAALSDHQGMFHIRGTIHTIDESTSTFMLAEVETANFAIVTFANCTFGFTTFADANVEFPNEMKEEGAISTKWRPSVTRQA